MTNLTNYADCAGNEITFATSARTTIACPAAELSRHWKSNSPKVPTIGKVSREIFQGLEKLAENFPGLGSR